MHRRVQRTEPYGSPQTSSGSDRTPETFTFCDLSDRYEVIQFITYNERS